MKKFNLLFFSFCLLLIGYSCTKDYQPNEKDNSVGFASIDGQKVRLHDGRLYFESRIDFLRETNARVKFLSLEPLISPLPNLNLEKIDWVIVGGESGHNPRPMNADWVIDIQEQCQKADVAFFFKQWGGKNKKKNGRILNGRTYDEMPELELQHSV